MKYDEIIEKLEAYVIMKNFLQDEETWKIRTGQSFHEGIKKNNYIKVLEKSEYMNLVINTRRNKNNFWQRFCNYRPEWNTYLEILYTESFVTFNLFLKPEQKKTYEMFRKLYLENRDIIKDVTSEKITAVFKNHNEFDKFFETYVIGNDIFSLC